MRYFLLTENKDFSHRARVTNWNGKIDVSNLVPEKAAEIESRIVLETVPDKEMLYTDIILYPFLMYSEIVYRLIQLFEPNLEHKEIIFFEKDVSDSIGLYYLPILDVVDCLTSKSQYNFDHSDIEYGEIDRSKVGDKAIFVLGGLKKRRVVVRLDLVEALIRREVTGIGLDGSLSVVSL